MRYAFIMTGLRNVAMIDDYMAIKSIKTNLTSTHWLEWIRYMLWFEHDEIRSKSDTLKLQYTG